MILRPLALAAALLAAGQAAALSCLRPDVIRSFNEVAASEDQYVILLGTFVYDPADLPGGLDIRRGDEPQPEPIETAFFGEAMTLDGDLVPYTAPVLLQLVCLGPWCGGIGSGQEVLAFARWNGVRLILETGPCGGRAFEAPTDAQVERVRSCLLGQDCSEADPFR